MPIPDDDLTPLYACGKAIAIESNGRLRPDGAPDTDNPHEGAHWWGVYLDGRRVATGRTLDAAVRLAADVCRGAR